MSKTVNKKALSLNCNDDSTELKKTEKKKIERLVSDSSKNYTSYLKLIYTGDSELSSEDELDRCMTRHQSYSNNTATSPESVKLLDADREKLPTPTTCSEKSLFARLRQKHCGQEERVHVTNDNAVYNNSLDPAERREVEQQLEKLQDEITTLRKVLNSKMEEASALKHKLGITAFGEFTYDLKHGLQNIKESGSYQKTSEAIKSFGSYASKKVGDIRNSSMFKSMEDKMGGAYDSVKSQLANSRSETNVIEVGADSLTIQEMTADDDFFDTVTNPYAEIK